jgi:ParB family transcriptional regulator, chromosome partitioning protein
MNQAMSVLTSEETVEWYTPPWVVAMVASVLGEIDLDPASCEMAQRWIRAAKYYTKEQDGLSRSWFGRVWLNPPFENAPRFVEYLVEEFEQGRVYEAVLLVNSNLGYKWYEDLWIHYPVCMIRDRMRFINEQGIMAGAAAKRAQTLVLFHRTPETLDRFVRAFTPFGRVLMPLRKAIIEAVA